jgi:CRISPR-associated protein Cmr3
MWIFSVPDDVWLFRDGKPFAAGDVHRAVSLFPPTSNTVQGALRSKALISSDVSLADFKAGNTAAAGELAARIGGWGAPPPANFMQGPFLSKSHDGQITRYFPLPSNVVKVGNEFRCLGPCREPEFIANYPDGELTPLWATLTADETPKEARGWLAEEHLLGCLARTPPAREQVLTDADLFAREPRVGVKIAGKEKRAEEGHLFQIEFIRSRVVGSLEEVGLLVESETMGDLAATGMLQLGGEMRAAQYRHVEFTDHKPVVSSDKFTVYFATPAYFANGWRPADWSSYFGGAQLKLIAAALGRPQPIGGFDFALGTERALRRYVPPGSVYFFQAEGGSVVLPPALTDDGANIGFGHYFIGGWDYV